MLMIVVLHVLGHGGILKGLVPGSIRYNFSWYMEIMCLSSVNCFAIISGYLNVNKKYNFKSLIYLWLQVLFYSVLLIGAANILMPGRLDSSYMPKMIFPVINHSYWYFTAYFGLYLVMPLLNMAFDNADNRKTVFRAIFLSVGFISAGSLFGSNLMWEASGYSTIWLIFMYLIGAYIKKYGVRSKYVCGNLIVFFVLHLLAAALKITIDKYFADKAILNNLRYSLLGYTSPFTLLASICLFMFFESVEIKNKCIIKCVGFLAPMAFGVYLIHTNAAVWEILLKDAFAACAEKVSLIYFAELFGIIIGIYVVCSAVDYLRIKLFEILKVKDLIGTVDRKIRGEE